MSIRRLFALLSLALACFLVSASEQQQVSAEKFRELVSLPVGTMRYSEYLGVSNGSACLALHEMSLSGNKNWSKQIYCSDAKALDPAFLKTLVPVKQ